VAIFGLFGKKDGKSAVAEKSVSSDKTSAVSKPEAGNITLPARPRRDPDAASATARKIDAIESEMSEEFTSARLPSGNTLPAVPVQRVQTPPPATRAPDPRQIFESTLPSIGMSTEFLLGPQAKSTDIIVSAESAQVVEEAAILYASGQAAMAEQVLLVALQGENLIDGGQRPWWMLFDLYQLSGRQAEFDNLSMSFASRFETSPPSWRNLLEAEELLPASLMLPKAAATPTVAFVGKLDSSIVRLLERVQKQGESSPVLRLDFTRVAEVDPIGCGLLLKILKRLHTTQHELVLVGANELAKSIRAILKVGRRDETEAPWLLLLEILRLLNSESEFEEVSMDYCVTFEVSPPAFDPPRKVTTESAGSVATETPAFAMPQLVEGKIDSVLTSIAAYAGGHDPVLLDCTRLRRIDFNAAGQLLSTLAPVAAAGRVIEFTEVNQMVAALLDVIGLNDIARVSTRKS
jgi:anti-anti-sigma regulatory factor